MSLGKLLIGAGLLLVVAGAVVIFAGNANVPLGRLPGDIAYRGRNTSFYFPIVTCIIISVVLSLLMWLVGKFTR
jgi:heme/copper-type cytochrome/quinol oxidase subunit 2